MQVLVGTSGYAYPAWKGSFYPSELKPAEMLRYYADRLATVEINNTFYRMPSEKLLDGWAQQVPPSFSFALKAPRRITHQKKLGDAEGDVGHLLSTAAVLGERLGPFLFQLPPYFKQDVPRLAAFLEHLPRGVAAAVEFRHASWFDEAVYEALRARQVALVIADADEDEEPPVVATADYGYLRLRRQDYDDAALARWAERIAAQPWQRAHVFFKHEDEGRGPHLAARMLELLAV